MKVRLSNGRLRVRLDDLELAALERNEILRAAVSWPGGGWSLSLDPTSAGLGGDGGELRVGVREVLAALSDPAREGVTLDGPPRVSLEKEFGPQHA